jgi:hypothetical protein
MESCRVVPGSSTDKGKLFISSTQHPDQRIQCVLGEGGTVLQGKCPGVKQVTQLSCWATFQNE